MARWLLIVTVLVAACGGDDSTHPSDAKSGDSPPTDTSSCSRVLFINYEGGSVTGGAADDAPTNTSNIPSPGTYSVPAYLASDGARATKLQTITNQVTTTLAAYVTVVTTRPASGRYHMIIVGGSATDIGLPSSQISGITGVAGCQTGVPKAISFVFSGAVDANGTALARDANYVIGLYGASKAVPWSTSSTDCMCAAGNCTVSTSACTIGGAATPRDSSSVCGSGATFDEMAAFAALPCD